MTRLVSVTMLAALTIPLATLATPLAAQDLERPADWKVRFDRAGSTEADLEMFVEMPPGWHITTGPSGIFWDPAQTASGEFRIEMEVFLFDPGRRREAFGIFFAGNDLEGEGQAYTYFLIRNGCEFIVKRRTGAEAPTIQPWTGHEAILSYADRGEDASVKNVLAVESGAEQVRFFVNGEEVASVARADVATDGIVGIRVNHGLNLHVSRLEVMPAG
jgi:hypothetical protein